MKIFYVKDNSQIKEDITFKNLLLEFSEVKDLIELDSIENLKTLIVKNLIQEKKYADLICIFDLSNDNKESLDFANWLRCLQDTSYMHGFFNLNYLPIVLIQKEYKFAPNPLFNETISKYYSENGFKNKIEKVITNWRQQLLADLDLIDLDASFNFKSFNKKFAFNRLHELKIITNKFIDECRGLNFIWIGNKLETIDVSVNEFNKLLKRSEKFPKNRNEKEIHEFLKKNEYLLLGEYKNNYNYEKHFYLSGSKRYVEPDFIFTPHSYTFDLHEIFEVKLPNHIIGRKDKSGLLKTTIKNINQVTGKYYNYFHAPQNICEIQKRISVNTNDFDYTLLIGRKRDLEENYYHLKSEVSKHNPVQIISYDELIERFERLYERTKKYKVD